KLEYFGKNWNILEKIGIFWKKLEYFGKNWNILDFFGIIWNILEYFGEIGKLKLRSLRSILQRPLVL
ncbi:MAG: hypothetical protein ACPH28_03940, partial [Flavobacteriaceae bacterium]